MPFVEPLLQKIRQTPPVTDDVLAEVLTILSNIKYEQARQLAFFQRADL